MHDILLEAQRALAQRDFRTAAALARSVCGAWPDVADAWYCLGVALLAGGRAAEAVAPLEEAFARAPHSHDAGSALAAACQSAGRTDDACRHLADWLSSHGEHPRVRINLGVLRESLGQFDAACEDFQRVSDSYAAPLALRLEALRGATTANLAAGRPEAALRHARDAVALEPDDAVAQFNLAEVALACDRPEEALTASAAALALDPSHTFAAIDRAVALAWLGEFDAARRQVDAALARDPAGVDRWRPAHGPQAAAAPGAGAARPDPRLWFAQWHERLAMTARWERRDALRAGWARIAAQAHDARAATVDVAGARVTATDLDAVVDLSALPHRALAADLDAHAHAAIAGLAAASVARRVAREVDHVAAAGASESGDGAPATPAPMALAPNRTVRRDGRLRIGYLCADWRDHPTARLTHRHYAQHDRSRWAVFGYHLHAGADDARTADVARGIETFRRVATLDDAAVAHVIREDRLDVLVDLGGWLAGARPGIVARRPCARQVAWLGYPGTSGAPWIDAAVVDAVTCPPSADGSAPGSAAGWTERLLRLPRPALACDPDARAAGPPSPDRAALGLAADAIVIAAFHVLWKLEPAVWRAWCEVLTAVPHACLWLLDAPPAVRDRLVAAAAAHGVAAERLVFAPRAPHAEHLARLMVADLMLDPWICSGHTTAAESLAVGVPLVTLTGSTCATRIATALLRAVGLPELATPTPQAYVATATALARDGIRRAAVRQTLQTRVPVAFAPEAFCRDFETTLERWLTETGEAGGR